MELTTTMLILCSAISLCFIVLIYNHRRANILEDAVIALQLETDYLKDLIELMRKDHQKLMCSHLTNSSSKKRKRGRPVDPNSRRQQRLKRNSNK